MVLTHAHVRLPQYHPIEIDDTVPHDVKAAAMVEWWTGAHDVMIEAGVKKQLFADLVCSPDIMLRPGTHQLFALTAKHKVPLHIFSAGVGDVIVQGLKRWGVSGKSHWAARVAKRTQAD